MTDKTNPEVEIVEGFPEWGEEFGLVLFPEHPACPHCGSIDVQKINKRLFCCVCNPVWPSLKS